MGIPDSRMSSLLPKAVVASKHRGDVRTQVYKRTLFLIPSGRMSGEHTQVFITKTKRLEGHRIPVAASAKRVLTLLKAACEYCKTPSRLNPGPHQAPHWAAEVLLQRVSVI